ncbi:MAG: HD domain-containing protein [Nitrospira sp.]|nr:HD domain-containing protein [Nitrospira sp.]
MRTDSVAHVEPTVLKIQRLLEKIDRLLLPAASRRDVESILVRQIGKELDHALPWQAGHAERTAAVACMLAEAFELNAIALHELKLAALLHDIGLLMGPVPFCHRLEPFDPSTSTALQCHARLGANLLEPFAFLKQAAILVAHHHEWWDGSGYPYGIRGPYIPLGARILAVADAFDAIKVPGVQDRALRDRIALRILRVAAGTQFDPAIVATLWNLFTEASPARCIETSHL